MALPPPVAVAALLVAGDALLHKALLEGTCGAARGVLLLRRSLRHPPPGAWVRVAAAGGCGCVAHRLPVQANDLVTDLPGLRLLRRGELARPLPPAWRGNPLWRVEVWRRRRVREAGKSGGVQWYGLSEVEYAVAWRGEPPPAPAQAAGRGLCGGDKKSTLPAGKLV